MDNFNLIRLELVVDFEKGSDLKKEILKAEYKSQINCFFVYNEENHLIHTVKDTHLMLPSLNKTKNGIFIVMWCREDTIENAKKEILDTANQEFLKLQESFNKIKKIFADLLS